jgi:putative transposase
VPVTRLCTLLDLPRSGYYRWRNRPNVSLTRRELERQELALVIALLFHAHHQRPGRRPMQALLATAGYPCSLGRVDRLMRELRLQARRGRKRRQVPRPGPSPALTAHIANHCLAADGTRDFASTRPGARTVGDITRLPTADGPVFLATVLDLATRRVLGWALAPTEDTALTGQALSAARDGQGLAPAAIFHSDRGTQYTSHGFQAHCAALTVTQSMGATGVCWDNAVAEAFFATLKADLRSELGPMAAAATVHAWVARYIADWYNDRRPHTHNAGLPPTAAWDRLISPKSAVPDS